MMACTRTESCVRRSRIGRLPLLQQEETKWDTVRIKNLWLVQDRPTSPTVPVTCQNKRQHPENMA